MSPVPLNHLTLSLLVLIATSSCGSNIGGSEMLDLEYAYQKEQLTVHPEFTGIWRSIGNGYMLEADEDSIQLYSYTRNFCYQEKNDYLIGQLHTEAQFFIEDDTLSLYLTDYGDKTANLQVRRRFVKIENLPNGCLSYQQMSTLNPKTLYQLFIETAKENYAFTDERSIDWDALYNEYLPQISTETTTEEFFELLGEIVTRTKDHHTKIIDENGRRLQYGVTPSASVVIDSFNTQTPVPELGEFFQLYFQHNYQNISDSLLHGKGQKVANQQIEWGYLNESIGYINIHAFAGFGDEISRKQQIDTVAASMEYILQQLQHTNALVIDISFNFGGFDASVFTMAGYFIDRPLHAYTSQVFAKGDFHQESEVIILPASNINYTKPVYVLMTDISRSAAEGFAMIMGELPHVKLVGMNTLGILSGMLGKSVGPFYLTLSNQRLVTPTGEYFEVGGVPPDIRMEVFGKSQVFDRHKIAVNQLEALIDTQIDPTNASAAH